MGSGSLFQVGQAVEFWRVLVHLSILAFCLVFFEAALHHVEQKVSRHDKYHHMLRKGYRELMVLGLLSLGLKLLKEVPGINAYSKTMLAFQVADLTIFILALALILQATVVFLQLRKHNIEADRIELITAQDLINAITPPAGTPPLATAQAPAQSSFQWLSCWSSKPTKGVDLQVVERRLLRHLFLRRFGLPQLFPFSKYLRRAQANQISHMIEVEPSMWVLLLAVAWMICGFLDALEELDVDLPGKHELVEVFVVFAWALVVLHVAVLLYFRSCIHQLLLAAGYSDDESTLVANLRLVAEQEVAAWQMEAADSALRTMNRVQEELEEMEDCRNAERHALLRKDIGLQLVATCIRNMNQVADPKKTRVGRATNGVQLGTPDIPMRFFSRKAWHVAVMFMLVLNGFFIALLVQCAVYDLDDIYEEFGLVHALVVPLPLFLNTFVFQQQLFRYFVIICSIVRVDANTMGEVVSHFSEIVELRSEFASSLLDCLKERDYTIIDLRRELHAYDPRQTGMIDVEKLRLVLAGFDYRLTRFRLNSVAMMLFELKGTKVEYGQLLRLLMLAQNEALNESDQPSQRRQHLLLRHSSRSVEERESSRTRSDRVTVRTRSHRATTRQVPLLSQPSLESEPGLSDFVNMVTPGLRRLSPTRTSGAHTTAARVESIRERAPMLDRSQSYQFATSSSRALHAMFNIGRGSDPEMDTESTETEV
uniref:EF-hand domain-containing protein n=1 Tax=Peronospora matthiolae TaxID=2874970 RepID=A0AAV1T8P2_9STRA